MSGRGRGAWAAAAMTALGGCSTLVGIDKDYYLADGGGAGGAPSTSSSVSSAATTGAGGETATSTASATSSGTGCMTTGLSTCTPTCGCAATQKCAVTDENAGTMTCITAGPVADWAKCNTNQDCGASSFCDHIFKVCKPICDGVGQCPANAQCIPAKQSDGKTKVTGVNVCTAHCNPTSAAPCGPNITCFYDFASVELDCSAGSNLSESAVCGSVIDCAKGLVCAGNGGTSFCSKWCTPINMTVKNPACPAARPYCQPLAATVSYEGTNYGVCGGP